MKTHHFTGEYAEGMDWSLEFGVELLLPHDTEPCRHAQPTVDGKVVVPKIVQAWNEGGCNFTMVCADCIVEALQDEKAE